MKIVYALALLNAVFAAEHPAYQQIGETLKGYGVIDWQQSKFQIQKAVQQSSLVIKDVQNLITNYPGIVNSLVKHKTNLGEALVSKENLLNAYQSISVTKMPFLQQEEQKLKEDIEHKNSTNSQDQQQQSSQKDMQQQNQQKLEDSAIKIQKVWRGGQGRQEARYKKTQKNNERFLAHMQKLRTERAAAQKIQNAWRKKKGYKSPSEKQAQEEKDRENIIRSQESARNVMGRINQIFLYNDFEKFLGENFDFLNSRAAHGLYPQGYMRDIYYNDDGSYGHDRGPQYAASLLGAWILMLQADEAQKEEFFKFLDEGTLLHNFSYLLRTENFETWNRIFGTALWGAIRAEQDPIQTQITERENQQAQQQDRSIRQQ